MKRSRIALFAASLTVILLLFGAGMGIGVGAADNTYRQVIVFTDVLASVVDNYVDPVDQQRLLEGAFEGMLGGLDSLGAYLSPQEVEAWRRGSGSSGPGIGVVQAFGALQIVSVDPGSPADRAGLVTGDQIRTIAGQPLRDLSFDQALLLLRGEPGSKVRLGLLHPRRGFDREEVELERVRRSAPAYRLTIDRDVAVLQVLDLLRVAGDQLERDLAAVAADARQGLLIDLRNLVERDTRAAVEFAGLFIEKGAVLKLRDRKGAVRETLQTGARAPMWQGRIGLLVNGATAGGAEAVAGALSETLDLPVFGEETFGLGAEPELFLLPDGAGVVLSTAVWETSGGLAWNEEGLEPTSTIRVEGREFEDAYQEQLRRAVDAFAADSTDRKAA